MTITSNPDGSYTVNGTATANTYFAVCYLSGGEFDNIGTVTLSGCPKGGNTTATNGYYLALYTGAGGIWKSDVGSGVSIDLGALGDGARIEITVTSGYTANNLKFWPQLEKGSTATAYAPYENIRPISGRDAVSVERCGENLLDIELTNQMVGNATAAEDGGWITINGTTSGGNLFLRIGFVLRPGRYTAKLFGGTSIDGDNMLIWIYGGTIKNTLTSKKITVTLSVNETTTVNVYLHLNKTVTFSSEQFAVALVPGSTPPVVYTPYRGDTLALALPSTVYGGTVDAVTGEGEHKWGLVTFDGSEAWTIGGLAADKRDWYYVSPKIVDAINEIPKSGNEICSHYPHYDVSNNNTGKGCALVWSAFRVRWGDIIPESTDAWKSYLAAQYAAGTPVQVAYKLAEPVPFRATGNRPLLPIPGETNTIMTDADSVTVNGRADPIRIIQQLQAAQSAAAAQLDETQQAMVDTTAMAVDYIYEQDSKIFGGEEDDSETDAVPT